MRKTPPTWLVDGVSETVVCCTGWLNAHFVRSEPRSRFRGAMPLGEYTAARGSAWLDLALVHLRSVGMDTVDSTRPEGDQT